MAEGMIGVPRLLCRPMWWWIGSAVSLFICVVSLLTRERLGTVQSQLLSEGGWSTYSLPEITPQVEHVTELAIASDGRLCVGTDAGLHVFDGETWESYMLGHFTWASVNALTTDDLGRIWVSFDRGVKVITDGQAQVVEGVPSVELATDGMGLVWGGDHYPGFVTRVVADRVGRSLPGTGLKRTSVRALAFGPDGRAWVSTSEGVGVYDGERWQDFGPIPELIVETIAFDPQGRAWVSGRKDRERGKAGWTIPEHCSLAMIDSQQFTQYRIPLPNPEDATGISALAFDAQGRLWAAFREASGRRLNYGLGVYDGIGWTFYRTCDAVDPISASTCGSGALLIDEAGQLWVGVGPMLLALDIQAGFPMTDPVPGIVWNGRKLSHWLVWGSGVLTAVAATVAAWAMYLQGGQGQRWAQQLQARAGDMAPARPSLTSWLTFAVRALAGGICLVSLTTFRGFEVLEVNVSILAPIIDTFGQAFLISIPVSAVFLLCVGAVDVYKRRTPTQLVLGILSILIAIVTFLNILWIRFLIALQ